jgi:hypothetical protein
VSRSSYDTPRRRAHAARKRLPESSTPLPGYAALFTPPHSLPPSQYFKAGITADSNEFAVYLDGRHEPWCIEARADLGWIECYLTSADGEIVMMLGEAQTHRYYGAVEIRRVD